MWHLIRLRQARNGDLDVTDHGRHALVVRDALHQGLLTGRCIPGPREDLDGLLGGLAAFLLTRSQLHLLRKEEHEGREVAKTNATRKHAQCARYYRDS